MILKIRDIHAFARDVAIDNGTLVFTRLIAYFVSQKGGYKEG